MHRAILGIWVAVALGAALASGCGGETTKAAGSGSGSLCEQTITKLRDCGLLSEGETRCETAIEIPCATNCLLSSTCQAIEPFFCSLLSPTGAVADCVAKCEFTCADGTHVPEGKRCNVVEDCNDGSDEDGCPGFACDNGQTVPDSFRCDDQSDCTDGTDEIGCTPFTCGSGDEVPSAWKCDGVEDCSDGSDEAGCPERAALACPEPVRGPPATCVEESEKLRSCGVISEGSTGCMTTSALHACESGCYVAATCAELTPVFCDPTLQEGTLLECLQTCLLTQVVTCADGEEVPGGVECDGFPQCTDQSDEATCPTYACSTGEQIPVSWKCDGAPDCPDGSDEVGCPPPATPVCDGTPT